MMKQRVILGGILLAMLALVGMPPLMLRARQEEPAFFTEDGDEEMLYDNEGDATAPRRGNAAMGPSPRASNSPMSLLERISLLEAFGEPCEADDFFHSGPCHSPCCAECQACCLHEPWGWHVLPEGLIYRSYLAGPREARFGSFWFKEQTGDGSLWDVVLGGRAGVLRYGNSRAVHPEGWQLDIEGAAFPRLDISEGRRDVVSTDFRFGLPLTYGVGRYQMKLAYYHLSSHLGDEFIERTGATRINYVRDAAVWGHAYFLTPDVRVYGEVAYAYSRDGGVRPWEFQFGAEYAPPCPTGSCGAPFLAVNALLQEEHDFGGTLTVQAGWAWRNEVGRLFRIGIQYLDGKSPQGEFFQHHEEQIGVGIWYDY
jgi:hypothetical protein